MCVLAVLFMILHYNCSAKQFLNVELIVKERK